MDKEKNVLFDPGFAPLVMDFIGVAGYTYYMFCANNNTKFKRLNFPHTLRKIESSLKGTVAFYLGCMLWASYLKTIDNAVIEGNQLLNEDIKDENEYLGELDFLIELIEEKLPKDCKYYTNKPYNKDDRYLSVLKTYREFLKINNGFIHVDTTDKIKLPENLKKVEDINIVYNNLISAINNKNIISILDMYDILF